MCTYTHTHTHSRAHALFSLWQLATPVRFPRSLPSLTSYEVAVVSSHFSVLHMLLCQKAEQSRLQMRRRSFQQKFPCCQAKHSERPKTFAITVFRQTAAERQERHYQPSLCGNDCQALWVHLETFPKCGPRAFEGALKARCRTRNREQAVRKAGKPILQTGDLFKRRLNALEATENARNLNSLSFGSPNSH